MRQCILIADDATLNRMLIKQILMKSLTDVVFEEAVNGNEVMKKVATKAIDLIILDLIMPEMDGYETLKRLKRHSKYSIIPVIVNSSIDDIHSIENTLKDGAIDYFIKPLSPDDMNIILPLKVKNALLVHQQNKVIAELNRQIQEELKNANAFVNIMLPKSDDFKAVETFIKYQPSMGIGGDFFDCVEKNNRIYFMVADVTGHGIAAGMASSMVKILFRKGIENSSLKPHEILEGMNHSIFEYFDFAGDDNYFVFTAFLGMIEGETLYYANAGQPYPIIYREASKSLFEVNQNGFLMGMIEDVTFETEAIPLDAGDSIFLYTDGLFCTGEAADFAGWTEVYDIANNLKGVWYENPSEFLDEILYVFQLIHKSRKTFFTDDVAMMIIRLKR